MSLFLIVTLLSPAFAVTIFRCENLDSAGETYDLAADIVGVTATCMNITADSVTLNCRGSRISGDNSSGIVGVNVTANKAEVRECQISDFDYGILVNGTQYGTIESFTTKANVIRTSRNAGIWLEYLKSPRLSGDQITALAASSGIRIRGGSNMNNLLIADVVSNASSSPNAYGLRMDLVGGGKVQASTFSAYDLQAVYASGVDSVTFNNNTMFAWSKGNAFYLENSDQNTISSNHLQASGGYGLLAISTSKQNDISRNVMLSASTPFGINVGSTLNIAYNNSMICLSTGNGIVIASATKNIISPNNRIGGTCINGLNLGTAGNDNNFTLNNVVINSTGAPVFFSGANADRNLIAHNNLTNGRNAPGAHSSYVISINNAIRQRNTTIFNNTLIGYNGTILLNIGAGDLLNVTANHFSTPASFGGLWVNNSDRSSNFSVNVSGTWEGNYYPEADMQSLNVWSMDGNIWGELCRDPAIFGTCSYPFNQSNLSNGKWWGNGTDYGPAVARIPTAKATANSSFQVNISTFSYRRNETRYIYKSIDDTPLIGYKIPLIFITLSTALIGLSRYGLEGIGNKQGKA